jgi:hypothetical protein
VLNETDEPATKDYTDREKDHIASLPVVVLKEFAAKGSKKDELWTAIADWAAGLTDAGVAQCIIISENANASSKLLNKALSSKPMNTITLADADPATALSFVAERLGLSKDRISAEEKALIGALGGRQTDLEGLVYKVRTGLTIADAMDDIISKSQMELRKALFGDDSEEVRSLVELEILSCSRVLTSGPPSLAQGQVSAVDSGTGMDGCLQAGQGQGRGRLLAAPALLPLQGC